MKKVRQQLKFTRYANAVLLLGILIVFDNYILSEAKGLHSKPRFLSFNSNEGNIDINLEFSVPFITIPLAPKDTENGVMAPLANINLLSIGVAGLLVAVVTFIVPLFTRNPPDSHYRSLESSGWSYIENSLQDIIFGDNAVTPCVQKVLCSIASTSSRYNNSTSNDQVIDDLTSTKFFEQLIKGTSFERAIQIGRDGNEGCSAVYKNCPVSPEVLDSFLLRLGAS